MTTNGKTLTVSRKLAKILTVSRKSHHHPIEILILSKFKTMGFSEIVVYYVCRSASIFTYCCITSHSVDLECLLPFMRMQISFLGV